MEEFKLAPTQVLGEPAGSSALKGGSKQATMRQSRRDFNAATQPWQVDSRKQLFESSDAEVATNIRILSPYRDGEHSSMHGYAWTPSTNATASTNVEFEAVLHAKTSAAKNLAKRFAEHDYNVKPIVLGLGGDVYPPLEQTLRITRSLLQLLLLSRHPVVLLTQSCLVERDIDLLQALAAYGLIIVSLSVSTLNSDLSTRLQPSAATPSHRLACIEALSKAGIPVCLNLAPLVPELNEREVEAILGAASSAGASMACYRFLNLPSALSPAFVEWLSTHYPFKMDKVIAALDALGLIGTAYEDGFGLHNGQGLRADAFQKRFITACRQYALQELTSQRFVSAEDLPCDLFKPQGQCAQMELLYIDR